jgi:cobalt-precorrin-5B (C1)-methyltransferase
VAAACNIEYPCFVPGRIGAKAAQRLLDISSDRVVEVGNEWGFTLDKIKELSFKGFLIMGHPGKLAKLPQGHWDTHSSRSPNAVDGVSRLSLDCLGFTPEGAVTVEGLFASLDERSKRMLGSRLARDISDAVSARIERRASVAVILVDLRGEEIASNGDLSPWTRSNDVSL